MNKFVINYHIIYYINDSIITINKKNGQKM